MKNVQALLFTLLCLLPLQSHAEEECNGIFLITPDEEVCIMLPDRPIISYSDNFKEAIVEVAIRRDKQYIYIPIEGADPLKIVYGTYVPTSIDGVLKDKVLVTVQDGRKYITGGKLIIVKDNKMYNIDGSIK